MVTMPIILKGSILYQGKQPTQRSPKREAAVVCMRVYQNYIPINQDILLCGYATALA